MTPLLPGLAGALVVAGLIGMVVGLRQAPDGHRAAPDRRPVAAGCVAASTAAPGCCCWSGSAPGLVDRGCSPDGSSPLVLVPAAVVGLPILLSAPPPAAQIDRLEAMEEWTRSLSGVLTVGVGLEQALVATLRSTPDADPPRGHHGWSPGCAPAGTPRTRCAPSPTNSTTPPAT